MLTYRLIVIVGVVAVRGVRDEPGPGADRPVVHEGQAHRLEQGRDRQDPRLSNRRAPAGPYGPAGALRLPCDCCNVTRGRSGGAPDWYEWPETSGQLGWASSRSSPRCSSARSGSGCGSCRRSKPRACRPPSTSRSLRTVLIPPVRGQIIDADGRLLADNEATNTVAVDWAQIRKATDRATLFQRLSGWLGVTVADMEARYQADIYSRVPAAAARRGRARERRDRDPGALRGLPRRVRAARLLDGSTRTPRWRRH